MLPLKIGVNARVLAAGEIRGWARYTVNLLQALSRYNLHFYLFSDRPLNKNYLSRLPAEKYTVCIQPSSGYFYWEQVTLAQLCRQYSVDFLHCPVNYGLPLLCSVPTVITIHDAIDEMFNRPRLSFREKWQPSSLIWNLSAEISRRKASAVITVSEHAKLDIIKCFGISAEKITVIYEAADPVFDSEVDSARLAEMQSKYSLEGSYFFYVGGWEDRKNVDFMIETFLRWNPSAVRLVLAGGSPGRVKELREKYQDHRLKFIGWVEDQELPALYKAARAFVYPSVYEGFGLQLVEAMKMGCAVLSSNRTSLPEVLGDGGIFFAPDQQDELISCFDQIMDDKVLEKARQHSLKRSRDFSWEKTAELTWDLFLKITGCSTEEQTT